MSKVEVFICSAVRTPIGAFQGSLADVVATRLGATAVKAALERAGVAPDQVGEVYMGNVLTAGEGQAPARQAATNRSANSDATVSVDRKRTSPWPNRCRARLTICLTCVSDLSMIEAISAYS